MNYLLKLIDKDISLDISAKTEFCDSVTLTQTENGYVVKRVIKNNTCNPIKLAELRAILTKISFDNNSQFDYFYTNENARLYGNLTIPVDFDRTNDNAEINKNFGLNIDRTFVDPGVKEGRILSSPYQPFPAILISNKNSNLGIVVGSLSQDVFYHNFNVGHNEIGVYLEIYSSFKGVDYRILYPNEELVDIFYIGDTVYSNDINKLFDKYNLELRKYLKNNIGSSSTNRHTLIWDSWNDGVFRDVSEEMLLTEAKAVKEHFSNVEWFQVDDGYTSYCHENVDLDAHGLGCVYEGEEGIDYKKFPNGLKGYTDKIKQLGLKPAVWIGGFCPINSKIYKEKKDWFIDYTYRVDWTQPLDVSKSEVREYMLSAIDKFTKDYGFEGIKHDFWSYAFEDRHNLLNYKDLSGYEYREWWTKAIRQALPEYGYVETGCDISMGNPFIGKYFNNFRYGLDVGVGIWDRVVTTAFWGLAVLSTHSGDLFIPNSDSIGILKPLNDVDYMFVVNMQIITRSICEISGRFSKVSSNDKRLNIIKKATKYLNNGENVYFAKYDYRKNGKIVPEIIYINSAFDSPSLDYITVAVFNAENTPKTISFTNADIGLNDCEHIVEYVWESQVKQQKDYCFELEPHGSLLLKIKK